MPQAKQATKRNVLVLGGVAGIAVLAVIGLVFALWPSQQSTATSGHTSTAPTSAASSTASQSSAFDPLIPEGSAVAMYDFPGTDFLRGNTTEIGVGAQIANDPASYPNSIVTAVLMMPCSSRR